MANNKIAKQKIRKGQGSKLNRTEIVQVRFNPRLRYAIELLARKEHRTVSSMIEKLVDEAIKKHSIKILPQIEDDFERYAEPYLEASITKALEYVWHTDEMRRFIATALRVPNLLSYEEERMWNFIKNNRHYWTFFPCKAYDNMGNYLGKSLMYIFDLSGVVWGNLQKDWALLKDGEIETVKLQQEKEEVYNEPGKIVPRPEGETEELVMLCLSPDQNIKKTNNHNN